MQKIQNIVFAVLACVMLFSVVGSRAIFIATNHKAPDSSELERRSYQKLGGVVRASFFDGEAQDLFEQYVADGVPGRDQVLLLNASLQRQGIETAAMLVGYDLYPTFFGSSVVAVRDKQLLVTRSNSAPSANSKELKSFLKTMNKAAKKHPDIRFSSRFTLEVRQSELNPTYALVSGDKFDSDWVQANIIDELDPALHAEVDPIESFQEIENDWFSTDPHWTLERALRTYDSVAEQLGLSPAPQGDYIQVIPAWQGSNARVGLDSRFTSTLWDLPIDFGNLHYYTIENDVLSEKERSDPGYRKKTLASQNAQMELANPYQGYGIYYGAFNGLIVNEGENNGKTCLIIGDSFTHCLKRFIAANYKETYSILPGNYATDLSLEKMIDKYKPDDVIYMTQAKKYNSFAVKSPKFIGMKSKDVDKSALEDADL